MRNTTTSRDTGALAHELSRENDPNNPVVQELRRQAANAFVLYANYKHYHWQTFGPLFRDMHKLFDELDLKATATFVKQASVDLGFASARFADMLNRTKSHGELQEAHTKLEASHKELQKRIAELTLDADIAKRERDKLQAFIDRTRRADQTKK